MRTASLSSVLSVVRSSLFRAQDEAAGWTHTNDIPRSAASCARTIHRCPVGSHATVTPANPARVRAVGGPVQRRAEVPRLAPERPPRQHLRVVVGHHEHLLAVGQVDPDDRVRDRDRRPQPRKPSVPVPIPARNTTTVSHERPPSMRWDTKPDKRIRRTFATPDPTAQNAFLCRTSRATAPEERPALRAGSLLRDCRL